MAIEDILRSLEDQAQADIDAVMSEAEAHAKLITDEAETEAQRIHDHYRLQVERVAEGKAAKVVNAAKLEAKMMVSSTRGSGLQSVFDSTREQLRGVRERGGYDELFKSLAVEALDGIEGGVTVRVAPSDQALAASVMSTLGVSADVVADMDVAGGLVVEADGGRVVRRNTLEDRLERARQLVEADVARVLFA